jgi:aryl-alcohol dehydrogenase-like predicted oxidoreductase
VGLGTNRFSVTAPDEIANLCEVLKTLTERGGKVVDTARGYGRAEEVIGECIEKNGNRDDIFLVSKYSTSDGGGRGRGRGRGGDAPAAAPVDHRAQLEAAFTRLRTEMIDVMFVHNLGGTDTLLPMMREMKQDGRFRYVGISISSDQNYEETARYMREGVLDFLEVDYSIGNRTSEELMLPLAQEMGVAVVCNVPFGGRRASVLSEMGDTPLPSYAGEIGCESWAQLYLKWIISHPTVTAVIPGTTKVEHAIDNNTASRGVLPDGAMRGRIAATYDAIAG